MKLYTFYFKLNFLENFIIKWLKTLKKAAPRFELGIKDLQSSALPLGHAAEKDSIESLYDLNSKVSHSLLFICNGHGEDVIASEIIKRLLKKTKNKNIEVLPLVGNGDVFNSIKSKNFRKIGYLKEDDLISVKNSFFGKTTGVIKEITAPFVGIYSTKELIEGFSD